ncbi:MAG TPA: DUF2589 domain-containing protein [Solirubrobacteraceae bacterium]|jgi:hypothetical protein|nr:DUF2589 domain-containing protein [Solirubrobacteraceae bacterium]
MPNPGQELSSIDFESMIGGPLCAVIRAQSQAALSTINFVKQVGFKQLPNAKPEEWDKQDVGDPVYVTFRYDRLVSPYTPADGGNPEKPAKYEEVKLSVPILTLAPIPYIRVADTKITFKAKIDAMERSQVDTSLKVDGKLEAEAKWFFGSAKLQVSTAFQRDTKDETQTTRSYSLDIEVHAVQDEMPGGLERILTILESTIDAKPLPKSE